MSKSTLKNLEKPPRMTEIKRTPEQDRWMPDAIILGLLCAVFILNCVVGFVFVEEDAYIDLRYVGNILNGDGFVFNPGEQPVEGFSNFLWVVILVQIGKFGFDPELGCRFLGVFLGIGIIFLTYFTTRKLIGRDGILNLVPPAMIAFSPPLVFWYQAGLESALYSILILALIYYHLNDEEHRLISIVSGIICFLLAITRPEGILFFGLFTVLKFRTAMQDDRRMKSYIFWFFACFFPFLLFLAYRFSLFGSMVPNTYYAKVNYSHIDALKIGFYYTLGFIMDARIWLVVLPAIPLFAYARGVYLWRRLLPLIVFLGYVLFVLFVGGDFHIHWRFYAPLLPLLFMFCAAGLWELREHMRLTSGTKAAVFTSGICAIIIIVLVSVFYRSPAWRDLDKTHFLDRSSLYYRWTELSRNPSTGDQRWNDWLEPPGDILDRTGSWLSENYPPDTKLATDQCGKVPYHTGFNTYDLLGLNNVTTAKIIHYGQAFEKYFEEFEAYDPDIVLLYYGDKQFVDRLHIGRMVESVEFQSNYALKEIIEFTYVYHLDEEYSRERSMLLFERREKSVKLDERQSANEMIEEFTSSGKDPISFVVEL